MQWTCRSTCRFDVLVDEMRDAETISLAIAAA
jgi:Tfp pilus assembly pilus retraction ATPase PilT